jgi:Fur family transcriptional regulator, iron response regulator
MGQETIRSLLLKNDIQASAPRLAVADFIFNTDSHPSAEEVKLEVEKRMPAVSLATVYNTLHLFVEKGLLKAVRDPKNDSLRFDCNTKPHFHFYDEETGRLYDLDPRLLRVSPDFSKLNQQFEISEVEVTVKGRLRSPLEGENK